MFTKILIANRGEIACRIIKTARKMGVRTVAVYSDADQHALHVKMADQAIHIGASPSKDSYLVDQKVIDAALVTGAQAIHPGYGFLSENADFAQQCAEHNLVFIGPPVEAIKAMGSKSAAKNIMSKADVPLVPGYHGDDQNPALLRESADSMGYPVLLKAVAGGGGKGMRQVWNADEFEQALVDAKRESMASFGNDDMLVEKYLTQPRHVEVQVFCDQHGNGVYLFERDCSIQRRHQKVIEEAPAPNMPTGLREQMGEAAVRAAQAINYEGAGTVEFLLDVDGSFYFMEMNTRLQVEHPITELITGQDLVEWQLQVANGEPLPLAQSELQIDGHAFEARVYAEDPNNDFLPTTGTLEYLSPPAETEYVRVDTGVVQGDEVSPYYDPMIAKLIVWDRDRDRALARLVNALSDYHIGGITTNIGFLHDLASCQAFVDADLDTGFIDKHHDAIFAGGQRDLNSYLMLAGLYLVLDNKAKSNEKPSPWATNAWRMNQANTHHYTLLVDDQQHTIITDEQADHFEISVNGNTASGIGELQNNVLSVTLNGHQRRVVVAPHGDNFILFLENASFVFGVVVPDMGTDEGHNKSDLRAPMNGTVVDVMVNNDTTVIAGDVLLIMEAMKMQHTITAPSDGVVNELFCAPGDLVDGGAELLKFTAAE